MCGQRPLEKEEIIAHQRAFNQLDVVFEYRPMKTSHGLIAQKLIIENTSLWSWEISIEVPFPCIYQRDTYKKVFY